MWIIRRLAIKLGRIFSSLIYDFNSSINEAKPVGISYYLGASFAYPS